MHLKNINPLGDVFLPLLGRELARGETFEVSDEIGEKLLEQPDNYKQVQTKSKEQ